MSSRVPGPNVATTTLVGVAGGSRGLPAARRDRCHHVEGFWYFDPLVEGAPPTVYQTLAGAAVSSLWIWDPYLLEDDENALGSLSNGISVRLLTEGSCHVDAKAFRRMTAFVAAFRSRFPAVTLQVRCFDRGRYHSVDSGLSFHDRYLFIDDEVYMVGASLRHHHVREAASAVLHIREPHAQALVRQRFDDYWKHPSTVQIV